MVIIYGNSRSGNTLSFWAFQTSGNKKQFDEGYVVLKSGNKLIFKRGGLGESDFPYLPPKNLIDGIDKLQVVYNSETHLVLKEYYYPEELSVQNSSDIFIFNKEKNIWHKTNIEGQIIDAKVGYPYLLCRIGNMSQQGINYPVEYTGKWSLHNLNTQKTFILQYQPDSNIVYASNSSLLVSNSNKLLYVTIQNDEILTGKEIVIFEDKKMISVLQKKL